MNCPKCNKEMKLMCRLDEMRLSNGIKIMKVLGRCDDCDFDATWKINTTWRTDVISSKVEYDLKQYFFG
jgi:transcription elongation factor Elf1